MDTKKTIIASLHFTDHLHKIVYLTVHEAIEKKTRDRTP